MTMKFSVKNYIWKRVVAFMICIAMTIGMFPQNVTATESTVEKKVKMTVVDEDGTSVSGATINYSINTEPATENNTKTDGNGEAVITFSTTSDAVLSLTGNIAADGFQDAELSQDIEKEGDTECSVKLKHTAVWGVEVEATVETYEKDKHYDAATITGLREGDVTSYKLDDEDWTSEMPKIGDAGEYKLAVKVEREGYTAFETTVTPKVKNTFTVEVTGAETGYTGDAIELIKINQDDLEEGDIITYTVDEVQEEPNVFPTNVIPTRSEVGEYKVSVKIERENCKDFGTECTARIKAVDITGLSAELYEGTYDGREYDAVKNIEGIEKGDEEKEGDKIEYSIDNGKNWTTLNPKIKNAGTYPVKIRVTRNNNYNQTEVTEMSPETAKIEKKELSISFVKEHEESVEFNPQIDNEYDFSAVVTGVVEGDDQPTITYSVVQAGDGDYDGDIDITDMGLATIDEDGKLTVYKGGLVLKITATAEENDNYKKASVSYIMTVNTSDVSFYFPKEKTEYIVGTGKSNEVTNQEAATDTANYPFDRRETSYNVESIIGVELTESKTVDEILYGAGLEQRGYLIYVRDYTKLVATLSKTKTLDIVIAATRIGERGFIGATVTYTCTIKFGDTPSNIVITDPNGKVLKEPNGPEYEDANGKVLPRWYNTELTIGLDKEGYTVAKSIPNKYPELDETFKENTVKFGKDEQGEDKTKRIIYFRNNIKDADTIGAISEPVTLDKIERLDCTAPEAPSIQYDTTPKSVFETIYNFFNGMTQITLTGKDAVSGVHHFTLSYNKEDGALGDVVEKYEGIEVLANKVEVKNEEDGTDEIEYIYTATLTLPKKDVEQLRGKLQVTATDYAGLSTAKTDDNRIIVIDSIEPEIASIEFLLAEEGKGNYQKVDDKHYFSNNVKFDITIAEANFIADDYKVFIVHNGVSKQVKNPTWTHESDTSINYKTSLTLENEGEYTVRVEGEDHSENEMAPYESPTIIIDKTPPVITFEYSNGVEKHAAADNAQTATITIEEKNFRASDVVLNMTANDINGDKVELPIDLAEYLKDAKSWKTDEKDQDKHIASLSSEFADAIYNMQFDYQDLALNPAAQVKSGEFIVDHTEPSVDDMEITYSKSIVDTILEKITLGFYNPNVEVKFIAKDTVSGVGTITWDYNRQKDVSKINVEKYDPESIYWKPEEDVENFEENGLRVVQDSQDKSKFTATVKLPKKEAEQLRGNIESFAVDRYSNAGDKLTDDGNVIIVDTIAPELTAELTQASNTKGNKLYYNKDFTITLDLNEANFFKEDVVFEVSKNGGTFEKATVSWKDISTDQHIGTYKIFAIGDHSNDGDYVIRVNYKDRSDNEMKSYTSQTIVIDTINPTIDVKYSNTTPINTLQDGENHSRKYFNTTQVATITIHEHNFDAERVKIAIAAKEVSGNALTDNSGKSSWSSSGDDHTLTITYPGDANYTFDIDFSDLATNKMSDYAPDYFTVDKSAPTNLNVNYSSSVLETVLSGITFGFYDAKVTVTIDAYDNISKINKFDYSYVNADGVSSVNAELLNQLLEEAEIRYSNGDATGTAQFDIPRSELGGDTQFNGNVKFTATNRSGLESNELDDGTRIVVDNISPTATIEFNAPVNTANGISYFDSAVNVTITIDEANFYSEDVVVTATKDGGSYSVSPSWSDNSTDIHVGTFSLAEDGDYFFTVSYTDKSSNQMASYTSEQLTVDTLIEEPVITINGEDGNGKAYKDQVIPAVSFADQNFDTSTVTLTRTRYNKKNEDVTEEFITSYLTLNDKGGSGTFDSFKKEAGVDGIYTLKVSMTDKAKHVIEKTVVFTVNRFGSVYEFNDYLISLIENGGKYVNKIDDDFVITEYNADKLLEGSLKVEISKDGKPLDNVSFSVTPEINDQVAVGTSGWYQYKYTISKQNFSADGIYKVSISSKDATGNMPETANFENRIILFRVDSTPPEISSISGLEESIINAQNVEVKFNVYDTIGLAKITVYVDDAEVMNVTDFSADQNNYQGAFALSESSSQQSIRIVAEDLAGNITDTSTETFMEGCVFTFNPQVTVSTNTVVRAAAWSRAHVGVVVGIAVIVVGAISAIIFILSKRKKEDEAEE